MNLFRATATIGSITAISRVLGFARDILIAASLGAGAGADAFFVAFKFPNLFRRLFAEGAFSSAFIPIFAGKLEINGVDIAQRFVDEALAILLWFLLVLVITVELFMPFLMMAVAPGFLEDTEKFKLTVFLARLTFPYILFISVASLFAGVLNSLGRFSAAAATPILLNISLIGSIIWLAQYTESTAHALSWGVTIAGVLQLLWLLWAAHRAGFVVRFVFPRLTVDSMQLIRRIIPVAVGAGIYQINLVVDTIIASFLPAGSISYLFYSDRVTQFPLGVVGVAIGTALLPLLARQIKSGDRDAAKASQNHAIELSLLATFPAAISLVILSEPIIQTLFERQEFGQDQTLATANALAVYAWGLPAYILIKSLTPGFFAREDTSTPIKISIFCIIINLCLNLLLMGPFLHVGIAMATAVSSWLNAILLAGVLLKRGFLVVDFEFIKRVLKFFLSANIMGLVLWMILNNNPNLFSGSEAARFFVLSVLIAIGVIVFMLGARLLGVFRYNEFKAMMRDSN